MLFNNDEEVRKECEKLGYAGVEARLKINDGYFGTWRQVASEWATQHREAAEEKRHLQIFRSAQLTAYASWALAVITFLSVGWQIMDSRE